MDKYCVIHMHKKGLISFNFDLDEKQAMKKYDELGIQGEKAEITRLSEEDYKQAIVGCTELNREQTLMLTYFISKDRRRNYIRNED